MIGNTELKVAYVVVNKDSGEPEACLFGKRALSEWLAYFDSNYMIAVWKFSEANGQRVRELYDLFAEEEFPVESVSGGEGQSA